MGVADLQTDSFFALAPEVESAVNELARTQHGVVSGRQLLELGVPEPTLQVRARPGGGYTRVLPNVFLVGDEVPGPAGQLHAALLYAGWGSSLLSGLAALHLFGIGAVERLAESRASAADLRLHVLIPHRVRRESHSFVRIERTRYLPVPEIVRGVPLAPPARAVIDGGRAVGNPALVRPIVAEALTSGLVTTDELLELAATMPVRGSMAIRAVLDEVCLGVEQPALAALRDRMLAAEMPLPHFMPTLLDPHGCFLARVHAYSSEAGIAILLTSEQSDLGASRFDDLRRTGAIVLSMDPAALQNEPDAVLAKYRAAFAEGCQRPRPAVKVIRPAGGLSSHHGIGAV